MATLFSGFTLALLLAFSKREGQAANLFLSAALTVIVLKTGGLSPIFLPALGPLLYFYVRRITSPKLPFAQKDMLHFCPLLVTYWMPGWLVLISVVIYSYLSHRLIQHSYNRLQPVLMDRPRFAFRALEKALYLLGLICVLWLFNDAFSFAVAFVLIGLAAEVVLKSDSSPQLATPVTDRYDAKEKGRRVKEAVAANRFYEDAELTLTSLAVKLNIHPHDLSRIINVGMEKNFSDFINEFRVRETARKMRDPAHNRLTLLGIAYESGFNSQRTFNRVFKEMTGKTPAEYKNGLKKELPNDKLAIPSHLPSVLLRSGSPSSWAPIKLNRNYMLKNYIKTAWRNLLKNKFYSFINIAGLTAGLAIGILILLWVQNELSFDGFHKQAANIYRLETSGGTGSSAQIFTSIVAPMAPVSKQRLPAVLDYVRLTPANFNLFKFQDKVFVNEKVTFADPSFFTIFDFPIIEGNPSKPFIDDNSVVITKETAKKYFGAADPIGKVIIGDNQVFLTVSGIINNFPKNSSLNYDMIMPMSVHIKKMLGNHIDLNTNFDFYAFETYLLLKPGIDTQRLGSQLQKIHLSFRPEDTDGTYLLLPLAKMHLYNADLTDKGISTVRIFMLIALLTLVIACINYVNLSTARSMLRAKEISMRKIVGAAKVQLFAQFMIETTLLFLIACLLAFGLTYLLMPVINQLSGKQLTFDLANYHVWFTLLAAITGTLVVSSIYPALLLSSFDPLKALKGKISDRMGDVLFRKILVVTQFTFSVVLIVGTIVITCQLNYIRSKQLGYDKSHTLSLWMNHDMSKHYRTAKAELLKQPGVLGITRASSNIVDMSGFNGDNDWDGKLPSQVVIMHNMTIDKDFMPFFKIEMLQGKGFTGAVADSAHFVLNETAVKELGMKNPIGQRFRMFRTKGTIIGVVKDFHFASLKEKIGPAVFNYSPDFLGTMYIKTEGRDAPKVITAAAKQFKQYNGQFPFSYAFLDDVFNSLYQSEQREGNLFNYFAFIAIFISCLGLLGLAAYTAQVRTREIGVRKVLGASVTGIVRLLAGDFIRLVLIAILIATPIAWFAMNKWLQDYAYRITIGWWVFALAGFIAAIIAFITISIQSIKAALTNPVKSLRSE
jgi:putative ABC transport system permease protein